MTGIRDAAWRIDWSSLDPDVVGAGVASTLFCVGNGLLGIRGATGLVDGEVPGTYVNGFYDTGSIAYPEDAYGFARTSQVIQAAPEATGLGVWLGESPIGPPQELTRELDLRGGVSSWRATYRRSDGVLTLDGERLVSFVHAGLSATRLTVSWSGTPRPVAVEFHLRGPSADVVPAERGTLDPRKSEALATPPTVEARRGPDGLSVALTAVGSRRTVVALAEDGGGDVRVQATGVVDRREAVVGPGTPWTTTRCVAYAAGEADGTEALRARCRDEIASGTAAGWDGLCRAQRAWLDAFWNVTGITVGGAPDDQRAIRWNLFQVAQASACSGERGVAAKGVTGSGYSGHYFWDSEIYLAPLLSLTRPEAARGLLSFRYATLEAARRRAGELSQAGACFPWRTITGEEASAYFPAGTAQYHINAAIAHALGTYLAASDDEAFLAGAGADILVETARAWASLAFWRADDARYHIHRVTGPDEYSALVDDNVYTNVMARHNLRLAAGACDRLASHHPEAHAALAGRVALSPDEPAQWRRIADALAVPYDEQRGINPQDAHFLELPPWDFAGTPADHYPLLLHYHPLVIYRHQVLKQADVVMAMFLRPDEFAADLQRRNFDFYEPLTTGDSSLSAIPQAAVAARVGRADVALRHFRAALGVDLGNTHRNTVDGVHVASASGVWSALVFGFAGLRLGEDGDDWDLALDPVLPPVWTDLAFTLTWRGRRIDVGVRAAAGGVETELHLRGPGPVRVWVSGEVRRLLPA